MVKFFKYANFMKRKSKNWYKHGRSAMSVRYDKSGSKYYVLERRSRRAPIKRY